MRLELRWDASNQPHLVAPSEPAREASREVDARWQEIAEEGSEEDLIRWVLAVGEKHDFPLDESWVRNTFADLYRWHRREDIDDQGSE